MARAIVYTDFDGVLNAFLEAEPKPSDLYSPERAFRLDGEATVHVGSGALPHTLVERTHRRLA